jgi:hypothetical protein
LTQFARAVDFDSGIAMIVTDLHGEGEAYERLKATFLDLKAQGKADRLIFCGDLIHGYRESYNDDSLRMLLDVMRMQKEYGADTIVTLMGNHELPHVYNVTLMKGHHEFTAPFEAALSKSNKRDEVFAFLKDLPFFVRTKAGVLICHAGASPAVTNAENAERILTFDHDALLILAEDKLQNGYDLKSLKQNKEYIRQAKNYLAVNSVDDPRFHHLLRGQILSQTNEEFAFLWDVLFATNEQGWNIAGYSVIAEGFLKAISEHSPYEQKVIVAGHISVQGGHRLVGEKHLRLASYAHASPHEAGEYLLLDCAKPIEKVSDLVPHLRPTYIFVD